MEIVLGLFTYQSVNWFYTMKIKPFVIVMEVYQYLFDVIYVFEKYSAHIYERTRHNLRPILCQAKRRVAQEPPLSSNLNSCILHIF